MHPQHCLACAFDQLWPWQIPTPSCRRRESLSWGTKAAVIASNPSMNLTPRERNCSYLLQMHSRLRIPIQLL
jgi:hypothetical protein